MSSPKLSLVIPVYNAVAHLESLAAVLDPVLNRSDIEIILVNDGSADDTLNTARQFAGKFQNVLVLDKANGGAASARNFGIRNANGKYLAFLDADDRMDFKVIESLLERAEADALDIIGFDLRYIDVAGNLQERSLHQLSTYDVLQTGVDYLEAGYQPSSICIFLVARAFVLSNGLFFEEGITHEDVEISFRWMMGAKRVVFTREIGYFYVQHLGSVTNQLTAAKKQKYLMDEAVVAAKMKQQLAKYSGTKEQDLVRKNYNSVVWNLLYTIYKDPEMLDRSFVTAVLDKLKADGLYPVKGPLKTTFQTFSKYVMNTEFLWKMLLNRKLK
ncbi:MAG: hypothetical protein BGO31_02425 [Bacteroidetes bacterium 43-16]|nr:MAG: hypothetical protein BGO31_02425 [Bacteroidetes bacterium 43-16]